MNIKHPIRPLLSLTLALALVLSITLIAPMDAGAQAEDPTAATYFYDENETEMDVFEDPTEPETPYYDENETEEDVFEDPTEPETPYYDENETTEDVFEDPTEPETPYYDENETEEDVFEYPEAPAEPEEPEAGRPVIPFLPGRPYQPVTPVYPVRPDLPSHPEIPIVPVKPDLPVEKNEETKPEESLRGGLCGNVHTPHQENLTLELWVVGADAPAYTLIAEDGSFTFENVEPGTYILKVIGRKHASRIFTVTVTEEVVELPEQLHLHLRGDLDGDGNANVLDLARVYSHVRGSTLLTDDYAKVCAKLTSGDEINISDAARLYAHIKGTKPLW